MADNWIVGLHPDFAEEVEAWMPDVRVAMLAQAGLLVGGDKSGVNQKRFYRSLVAKADARFDDHLAMLGQEKKS